MINHKTIISFYALVFVSIFQIKAQDLQADNMLLFQRASGGWFKQFKAKSFSYNREFTEAEKLAIAEEVKEGAATIDNGATCKEINHLVKVYKNVNNPHYLAAAEKGIRYLLASQYANGGFPQYFPSRGLYRNEITFNDNAMINVMYILRDVALKQNGFEIVDAKLIDSCSRALTHGVACILKTQINVKGKLTAWCQQYDEVTLQPAKARAYELPSITAAESTKIVEFLMTLPNPSEEIKTAVFAAVKWFESVKIQGYKLESFPSTEFAGKRDRKLLSDATASPMWARYYEIDTNRPFFCDRDGVVKYSIAEIGYERRNGYAWYGNWPKTLLESSYPKWTKSNTKK